MVTRKELREQREAAARAAAKQSAKHKDSATLNESEESLATDQPAAVPVAPVTPEAQGESKPKIAGADGPSLSSTDSASASSHQSASSHSEQYDDDEDETDTHKPGRLRRFGCLGIAVLIMLALIIGGGLFFKQNIAAFLNPESIDYAGPGTGSVSLTVVQGDTGSSIATKLKASGVVKTRTAFLKAISKAEPVPSFQPGAFTLKKHMKAKAALALLTNADNRNIIKVTIPEGFTVKRVVDRMTRLGFNKDRLTAALKSPASIGVPAAAHDAEGWLFPATYQFNIGTSETAALSQMVAQTKAALESAKVPEQDWNKTIILASIVQKEARQSSDFPKVARVLENRVKKNMLFQLDSTVAYGANLSTVTTTAKQRADKNNKYNTYAHPGLPIGAISNPGAQAIDAVVNPAKGDWIYFVTINLKTGETVFSSDKAGHDAAVQKFRSWIQKNPKWNGS